MSPIARRAARPPREAPARRGPRQARAFTVLELLLAVVIVGALAAFALGRFAAAKERAYVAALTSDLRTLATAQELHLDRAGAFAPTPGRLPGFRFSPDVRVQDAGAAADGWYAILAHRKTRTLCALVGSQAVPGGPATPVGRITCGQTIALTIAVGTPTPATGTPVTFSAASPGLLAQAFTPGATRGPARDGALLAPAALLAQDTPALGNEQIETLHWNFGDGVALSGTPAAMATVTHTYATGGDKIVRLAASTSSGRLLIGTATLAVDGPAGPDAGAGDGGGAAGLETFNKAPDARLALSATAVDQGQSLTADARASSDADGRVAAIAWAVVPTAPTTGAARPAGTDPVQTIRFDVPGTYEVVLAVTDDLGATATASAPVTVRATNVTPVAQLAFLNPPALVGQPLRFSAEGSIDANGDALTYIWDAGDFSPLATTAEPTWTHTFDASGPTTVSVTVRDPLGAAGTASVALRLNRAPVILQLTHPDTALTSTDAALGVAAVDPDGDPMIATWTWADGAAPTVTTPGTPALHRFTTVGWHPVTVTVADTAGVSATRRDSVFVLLPNIAPTASFTATKDSITTGQAITFDASASRDPDGDAITLRWDFGDGQTATGAQVSHTYAVAGAATVRLVVTDARGDSAVVSRLFAVQNPPPPPSAVVWAGKAVAVRRPAGWQVPPAPPVTDLHRVFWDGTQWVLISSYQLLLTTDFASYRTVGLPPGASNFSGLFEPKVFGGTIYLPVKAGNDGLVATTDYVTWSPVRNVVNGGTRTLDRLGTTLVGAGLWSDQLRYSLDGVNWARATHPLNTSFGADGLACNATRCVASGWNMAATGQVLVTTTDGRTWTTITGSTISRIYHTRWNGSEFLAVGISSAGNVWAASADGVTWTSRGSRATSPVALAWDGAQWLTVTDFGALQSSPSGAAWTTVATGLAALAGVATR